MGERGYDNTEYVFCADCKEPIEQDEVICCQKCLKKQYAKREELVEEIERILTLGSADGTFTMPSLERRNGLVRALDIIRTHGLEE